MLEKQDFNKIFREYYYALKLYARRFVLDPDLSEDIVQEVFCNLWKIRDDFVPGDTMRSYLFSAVYYRCLNHIKHGKIKQKHNETVTYARQEFERFYREEISAYESSLLASDFTSNLKKITEELPDQCRRIFLLSRKFGLKNREVAEFLQISIKVVERQLSKALRIIRGKIDKLA
jgi:RNA polymerase sigma-70 factor (ECF subfamily)